MTSIEFRRPDYQWDGERNVLLQRLWRTPMTYEEIGRELADEYGPVAPASIHKQLLKLGMTTTMDRVRITLARRKWTDEILEYTKDRWLKGFTATQIAREISEKFQTPFTRNAVIGKVNRMGIQRKDHIKKRNVNGAHVRAAPPAGGKVRIGKRTAPVLPAVIAAPQGEGVTIMQLTEFTCRAIISHNSDAFARYCGHRTGRGESFCTWHRSLYFTPYERRR